MMKLHLVLLASALAISACVPARTLNVPKGYDGPPSASKTSIERLQAQPQAASGARLYQKTRYRQASEEFKQVVETEPSNYRAAYLLGMSHLNRSRWENARDAFRLALELKPDRKTAAHIHNGLAYSYEAVRQTRMAHQHYHLACQYNKANGYAQEGSARTEYRERSEPKPRPLARIGTASRRPAG